MRSIGGPESVTALLAGGVDAAFFVTARPLPLLEPLFRSPAVRLMSFAQADAYTRRFRFLSKVTLPDGVIDLATDVPPYDVALLAPAAALVARDSLHHAIVDLVLQAATKVHAPGQLFAEPGQFPSARYLDVPLGDDAQRCFKSGPSFLRRHLPFWVATQVERLSLLLLPLVGLVFPLLGLAPTLFGSGIRRRLTRSYGRLLTLERQVAMVATPEDRARVLERLDQLEADVARLKIPATHAEHLYHLRTHVDFMRRRMLGGAADARPSEPRVERPRRAASA
jgi:hypothetical protein